MTTTPVAGPSGSEDQLIRCTDSADCYDQAREVCGGPYHIVDSGNRTTGSSKTNALLGSSWHEVLVHCGDEKAPEPTPVVSNTKSSEPKTGGSAPTSAAGFSFGQSPDEAKTACESAQLTWKGSTCSGTPVNTGMNAHARLTFCDTELCRIDLIVPPAEGTGTNDNVMRTLSTLQKRYGDSTEHEALYGETCTGAALPDCLRRGAAHFWYEWRWTGGKSLTVMLGPRKPHPRDAEVNPAADVTMRIRYDDGRFVGHVRGAAKASGDAPAKDVVVEGL